MKISYVMTKKLYDRVMAYMNFLSKKYIIFFFDGSCGTLPPSVVSRSPKIAKIALI